MGDKEQPAENASTRNGVDKAIKMVDIENCSTEKQMKSTFLEEDQLKISRYSNSQTPNRG